MKRADGYSEKGHGEMKRREGGLYGEEKERKRRGGDPLKRGSENEIVKVASGRRGSWSTRRRVKEGTRKGRVDGSEMECGALVSESF